MANMIVEDGKFVLSTEIAGAGTITKTLNTENKFVDKNIDVVIETPEGALGAGTGSAEASSTASGLLGAASSTQPATGAYIKVEGEANVAVTTSGWIDAGEDVDVSIADKYYPVNEMAQSITGAGLSEGAKSTAITSDGAFDGTSYDTSDKVKFESAETAGVYKIHSDGSVVVNRAQVDKQVTTAGYAPVDSSAVQAIAADSITVTAPDHDYYIKKSTLSASSVTPNTGNTQQTVTVGEGYAPSDRIITIEPMAAGAASSSIDNVGLSTYFNAGTSAEHDVELVPQHSIDTAGYLAETANPVAGDSAYYSIKEQTVTEGTTTVSGTTATRGTRTESVGWKDTAETLDVATFANSGTSGASYVDISDTTAAPVLVSGDYLYINKGWTDNLKISLAKLVPDGSDVKGHSEYILSGHSAYDDDGALVAGSIQTYDGSYTVA